MGYNTDFEGILTFRAELTILQLRKFNTFLGKEADQLPTSFPFINNAHSIGLELTTDYKGLKWNGQEKTYEMSAQLNAIEEFMNILLDGEFFYANDYHEQGFIRRGNDGKWRAVLTPREMLTTCPHCNEDIYQDEVRK